MTGWLWLTLAIVAEVVATSALNASASFTRLGPSVLAVSGYMLAFYCLSVALRTVALGPAYAVWSGAGIMLLALIGWLIFKQELTARQLAGLVLILTGILLMRAPFTS